MRIGSIVAFSLAVLLSLAGAQYRWGDSSHAMGLLTMNGGKVRHPSVLKSGWDRYAQITTATVLPPYRGNVSVHLEGEPALDYDIRFAGPVVDLGLGTLPVPEELALAIVFDEGVGDAINDLARGGDQADVLVLELAAPPQRRPPSCP